MQMVALYVKADNLDIIREVDSYAKVMNTSRSMIVLSLLRDKFGLPLDRKERAILEELEYQLSGE